MKNSNVIGIDKLRKIILVLNVCQLVSYPITIISFILMLVSIFCFPSQIDAYAIIFGIFLVLGFSTFICKALVMGSGKKPLTMMAMKQVYGDNLTLHNGCDNGLFYDFFSLNILRFPNTYEYDNYYSFTYHNIPYKVVDASLYGVVNSYNYQNNTMTSFPSAYFTGRLMIFDINMPCSPFLIKEKTLSTEEFEDFKELKLDNFNVNANYQIKALVPTDVCSILSLDTISKLSNLGNLIGRKLGFFFLNSKLYVLAFATKSVFDVKSLNKIDQKQIDLMIEDVKLPINIIEILEANKGNFNK